MFKSFQASDALLEQMAARVGKQGTHKLEKEKFEPKPTKPLLGVPYNNSLTSNVRLESTFSGGALLQGGAGAGRGNERSLSSDSALGRVGEQIMGGSQFRVASSQQVEAKQKPFAVVKPSQASNFISQRTEEDVKRNTEAVFSTADMGVDAFLKEQEEKRKQVWSVTAAAEAATKKSNQEREAKERAKEQERANVIASATSTVGGSSSFLSMSGVSMSHGMSSLGSSGSAATAAGGGSGSMTLEQYASASRAASYNTLAASLGVASEHPVPSAVNTSITSSSTTSTTTIMSRTTRPNMSTSSVDPTSVSIGLRGVEHVASVKEDEALREKEALLRRERSLYSHAPGSNCSTSGPISSIVREHRKHRRLQENSVNLSASLTLPREAVTTNRSKSKMPDVFARLSVNPLLAGSTHSSPVRRRGNLTQQSFNNSTSFYPNTTSGTTATNSLMMSSSLSSTSQAPVGLGAGAAGTNMNDPSARMPPGMKIQVTEKGFEYVPVDGAEGSDNPATGTKQRAHSVPPLHLGNAYLDSVQTPRASFWQDDGPGNLNAVDFHQSRKGPRTPPLDDGTTGGMKNRDTTSGPGATAGTSSTSTSSTSGGTAAASILLPSGEEVEESRFFNPEKNLREHVEGTTSSTGGGPIGQYDSRGVLIRNTTQGRQQQAEELKEEARRAEAEQDRSFGFLGADTLNQPNLDSRATNDYGASFSALVDGVHKVNKDNLNEPASEDYGGGWVANGNARPPMPEEGKTMTQFLSTIDKDLFKVGDTPRGDDSIENSDQEQMQSASSSTTGANNKKAGGASTTSAAGFDMLAGTSFAKMPTSTKQEDNHNSPAQAEIAASSTMSMPSTFAPAATLAALPTPGAANMNKQSRRSSLASTWQALPSVPEEADTHAGGSVGLKVQKQLAHGATMTGAGGTSMRTSGHAQGAASSSSSNTMNYNNQTTGGGGGATSNLLSSSNNSTSNMPLHQQQHSQHSQSQGSATPSVRMSAADQAIFLRQPVPPFRANSLPAYVKRNKPLGTRRPRLKEAVYLGTNTLSLDDSRSSTGAAASALHLGGNGGGGASGEASVNEQEYEQQRRRLASKMEMVGFFQGCQDNFASMTSRQNGTLRRKLASSSSKIGEHMREFGTERDRQMATWSQQAQDPGNIPRRLKQISHFVEGANAGSGGVLGAGGGGISVEL
ncbi:unnamed protein product [Amoebophrya sp. A25]|nr:unnamed protein product [Amoebophrya sp. A25]|eukprot:GSA25T00003586001.1